MGLQSLTSKFLSFLKLGLDFLLWWSSWKIYRPRENGFRAFLRVFTYLGLFFNIGTFLGGLFALNFIRIGLGLIFTVLLSGMMYKTYKEYFKI